MIVRRSLFAPLRLTPQGRRVVVFECVRQTAHEAEQAYRERGLPADRFGGTIPVILRQER